MEQLVGMSKSKREKIQNKNPPNDMPGMVEYANIEFVFWLKTLGLFTPAHLLRSKVLKKFMASFPRKMDGFS